MKVGTASKTTVGAAALIGLIFIGYIGIRQMNAPPVEERVYLSPWEDGTARPQNSSEDLAAQTNSTQGTESQDNQPQIAATESTSEMEPIGDFFGQPDEMDMAQLTTEVKFEPEADQGLIADTSDLLDDTGQAAEDVMNAFVEAFRDSDIETILPLLTENLRRDEESGNLYEGSDSTITAEDVERFEEIAAREGLTIDTTTIETVVVEGEGKRTFRI